MAEYATVARPYAEALFRAVKNADVVAWSGLIFEMANVAAHPDVVELVRNPNLTGRQIEETFFSALKLPVDSMAKNFIATLVENGRMELLPEIALQFQMLRNASEGKADAEIISAFELSDAQVEALVVLLEKRFGRNLNPAVMVDPSLIGGVRVVVGDEVLDTSIRAKLEQMGATLVV